MGAVGLGNRVGGIEDDEVGIRVTELGLGDPGQRVTGLDDVSLLGSPFVTCPGVELRGRRDLKDRAGKQEVGFAVQQAAVEIDELNVLGAIAESLLGDLPEAVTALDGVRLGVRTGGLFRTGCAFNRRPDASRGMCVATDSAEELAGYPGVGVRPVSGGTRPSWFVPRWFAAGAASATGWVMDAATRVVRARG